MHSRLEYNYYGNFYRTQLRSTLKRIDLYVIRWARRKFKTGCVARSKGARDWFDRLRRANPTKFAQSCRKVITGFFPRSRSDRFLAGYLVLC